eukprot:1139522-Pelagomonas_calceolata.AAC.2
MSSACMTCKLQGLACGKTIVVSVVVVVLREGNMGGALPQESQLDPQILKEGASYWAPYPVPVTTPRNPG